MNIRNAILSTASLYESRPASLDFTQFTVPPDPARPSCPLALIGYYLDMKPCIDSSAVAARLIPDGREGFTAQSQFFHRLDAVVGTNKWVDDAALCAKALRYYADMYHSEDVRIAA